MSVRAEPRGRCLAGPRGVGPWREEASSFFLSGGKGGPWLAVTRPVVAVTKTQKQGSHEATARRLRVVGASGWGGQSCFQPHAGSLHTGPGSSAVPLPSVGHAAHCDSHTFCCAALAHSGSATGPRWPSSQRLSWHLPRPVFPHARLLFSTGRRRPTSQVGSRCWNGTGPPGTPSQGWLGPRAPVGAVFGVGKDVATWWCPSRGPAFRSWPCGFRHVTKLPWASVGSSVKWGS